MNRVSLVCIVSILLLIETRAWFGSSSIGRSTGLSILQHKAPSRMGMVSENPFNDPTDDSYFSMLDESSSAVDRATIEEFHIEYNVLGDFAKKSGYAMVIGTSHISGASAKQVERYIERVRPDSVVVEIDLHRFPYQLETLTGIDEMICYVYKYEGSELKATELHAYNISEICEFNKINAERKKNQRKRDRVLQWTKSLPRATLGFIRRRLSFLGKRLFYGHLSRHSRKLKLQEGIDMSTAILASNSHNVSRLVLADRTLKQTMWNYAELMANNEAFSWRIARSSERAHKKSLEILRSYIVQDGTLNETEVRIAAYEALKQNRTLLESLQKREQEEAPEHHQAFIAERDELISNAIIDEIGNGANRVVAVVGLGHLLGIKSRLDPYNVGRTNLWAQAMQTATRIMETLEPEDMELMKQKILEMNDAGDSPLD
mmetsp:Transcript_13950/g.33741  ORF Transcript_13950/g.33741 Transcript_13950/m.33741 type:complete len:432 (-) Transcript_13950:1606-2901(-)